MTDEPLEWNGKTLQEMLEESEDKLENTGKYYGLDELKLKEDDPIRYEGSYALLRGALVSAREVALQIGSPSARFVGELCFGIYTPEGDSIATSTGIMIHVHTMSEAIKYMIREDYEKEVGVDPGDIFVNNDPDIGDVHTGDVQTIMPIFWKDELVGWIGACTHTLEIGGLTQGSVITTATERFDDGVYYSCRKVGSNDEIQKDYLKNLKKSVRTPKYIEMDEKSRLSGCLRIRDAIHDFIEEEGIEYYKEFIRETIEEGKRAFLNRVKERLVPGEYQAASFSDSPLKKEAWKPKARKDVLMMAPLELEVGKEGRMSVSFDGSTGSGFFPWNTGPAPMAGGLWVLLTQVLIHGDKVNDGAHYAIDTYYPEGSWCNPVNSLVSHQNPWPFLVPSFTGLVQSISRGFFSRGYREEVISGYSQTGDCVQGGGTVESGVLKGETFTISTLDIGGQGLGASAVNDGINWGYAMWNPETDLGDMEMWGLTMQGMPMLSKRVKPNIAGFGKYRGGGSFELVGMVYNAKDTDFSSWRDGLAFHGAGGISGGYPNATGYRLYSRGNSELIENKEKFPLADPDPGDRKWEKILEGKVERKPYATVYPIELDDYDLVHWSQSGGPGYGDPIERRLEDVKEDLEDGIYTKDVVRKVYGVVAEQSEKGEWVIDGEKTEDRREEIRREREENSVSFEEFWDDEREKLIEKELIKPVKRAYAESINLSDEWGEKFFDFWDLPEDFDLEVE